MPKKEDPNETRSDEELIDARIAELDDWRGETGMATRVATSSGFVNRPVGMAAIAWARTASAPPPVDAPIVAATPWSPSHRSVATGPGDTLLMRTPCGASSCESALERLSR